MPQNPRTTRIAMLAAPCFTNRERRHLRRAVQDAWDEAWSMPPSLLMQRGCTETLCRHLEAWKTRLGHPEAFHDQLRQAEITPLLPEDVAYPLAFLHMPDAPELLFLRGSLPPHPCLSIVGTRRMTSYGVRVLQELLPPAIAHGFGIISGLALGIDGTAHRITLDHHGYTLGILGTGIENASIYPRSHLSLATRILAEGGGLLSEFPPGTEGLPHHFPLRNRLIAAAGMATVVIEADVDSGSLITARAALDLGKDVFAVPGSIFSSASQGTHALLSQGAHPCVSVAALIDAIALDRPVLADAVAMTLPDDPFARAILETLTEPLTTDTLAERLDRPVPDVLAALALLELDSRVASPDRLTWIRLR